MDAGAVGFSASWTNAWGMPPPKARGLLMRKVRTRGPYAPRANRQLVDNGAALVALLVLERFDTPNSLLSGIVGMRAFRATSAEISGDHGSVSLHRSGIKTVLLVVCRRGHSCPNLARARPGAYKQSGVEMKLAWLRVLLAAVALLGFALPSQAVTYHIRTDGGDHLQCTGLTNASYPGSGTGQACAWSGLLVALPPGKPARFAGGDILQIHAGTYAVGRGGPGSAPGGVELPACSASWPYDCSPAPVPSGTAAKPTKIRGDGYSGTCANPPKLSGTRSTARVLNLQGSNYVEVTCLEITDNSTCIEAHTSTGENSIRCNRDDPPEYGKDGLFAADSSNVTLSKLNIHGLAHNGISAGRITNWIIDNVRIASNGWAGWDGDIPGDDFNSGTIAFSKLLVEYNGCSEDPATLALMQCWNQSATGYGDGFATGQTGANWIFTDSTFRYNTSDGLDLLYHDLGGTVTLNRVRTTGNAGNQIKIAGMSIINNGVIHANCSYFDGKAFTFNVGACRAGGDAVALVAKTSTDSLSVVNSTIVTEGNSAFLVTGYLGSSIKLLNNISVGLPNYFDPTGYPTDTIRQLPYEDSPPTDLIEINESYAVKQQNLKIGSASPACGTANILCPVSAGLKTASKTKLDPHLTATSPARNSAMSNAGDPLVPTIDYFGVTRGLDGFYDRGASEEEVAETF